ncbi:MAG: hypothetical protein J6C34_08960 [Oscillospiraceae bacterium]|nr:hypothetical protein [Oscillospiraceae bacterium]
MIYKLAQNGVSSLNLSIEYFKKLFYFSDRYNQYETDDNFKICITFLENAIELLLKTILVNDDPLSIYESPESKTIKKALLKVSSRQKLEDILISEGSFRTIKYFDTIKKYNEHYHKSDKIYNILSWLGEIRNAITHFGVSIDDTNELIVSLIDVYDVIYNYLYLAGPGIIFALEDGEIVSLDEEDRKLINKVLEDGTAELTNGAEIRCAFGL